MSDDPLFENDQGDESEKVLSVAESTLDKLSLDKIPLKVHLEVVRFQLSLEELQKLQVGQKLPLAMDPHLVYLTINGKAVGRAEIVEVGDLVGIKILEMYD